MNSTHLLKDVGTLIGGTMMLVGGLCLAGIASVRLLQKILECLRINMLFATWMGIYIKQMRCNGPSPERLVVQLRDLYAAAEKSYAERHAYYLDKQKIHEARIDRLVEALKEVVHVIDHIDSRIVPDSVMEKLAEAARDGEDVADGEI